MTNNPDDFTFKRYRCEWQLQCGTIDQYGRQFAPYLTFSFPTYEQAIEFRPTVAKEPQHQYGRWTPIDAPHDYCEVQINYVEVEVKLDASEEIKTLASAMRKFAPDLVDELVRRWNETKAKGEI